jgi:hypothetical protein
MTTTASQTANPGLSDAVIVMINVEKRGVEEVTCPGWQTVSTSPCVDTMPLLQASSEYLARQGVAGQ